MKSVYLPMYRILLVLIISIGIVSSCQYMDGYHGSTENRLTITIIKTETHEIPSRITKTALITDKSLKKTVTPRIQTPISVKDTETINVPYSAIKTGQYLLYFADGELSAISFDTRKIYPLYKGKYLWALEMFPNDHNVMIKEDNQNPTLLDIRNNSKIEFPFLANCDQYKISPDKNNIIASCSDDIFLFDLNGNATQLTNCKEFKTACAGPSFSPDGKWLAYYWSGVGSINYPKTGLYLMSTKCFQTASSCEKETFGPFNLSNNYAWSPNSMYIADIWTETIRIHQLSNNRLLKISEFESTTTDQSADSIIWSYDGDWIAFSYLGDISLLSSKEGKKIDNWAYVNDCILIGWIIVP